jgi:uncharacterized DUF497 family protein
VRITAVRWDEWSEDHIDAHRVGTAEVEGVIFDRASEQRTGREGTVEVYGRTDAGRRLLVVVVDEGRGVCFVVTARDMTDSERRLYEKRTKR